MSEEKLGGLALLRNLRNMHQADVEHRLIVDSILHNQYNYVLPFRFVVAARIMPTYEKYIDEVLLRKIDQQVELPGSTVVLVDVSDSMNAKLSAKSDLTRMDAAATLASIIPAEHLRVFSFSNNVVEVPARRGMAGIDAVIKSQHHGGTELGKALMTVSTVVRTPPDRLIVITDEQSHDYVSAPLDVKHRYMINVASNRNGVGYGPWTHIDGFSENVIRFIQEVESEQVDI